MPIQWMSCVPAVQPWARWSRKTKQTTNFASPTGSSPVSIQCYSIGTSSTRAGYALTPKRMMTHSPGTFSDCYTEWNRMPWHVKLSMSHSFFTPNTVLMRQPLRQRSPRPLYRTSIRQSPPQSARCAALCTAVPTRRRWNSSHSFKTQTKRRRVFWRCLPRGS